MRVDGEKIVNNKDRLAGDRSGYVRLARQYGSFWFGSNIGKATTFIQLLVSNVSAGI